MPNTKISAFTADATPDDADIIPYVDLDGGGAGVHLNKKITIAELRTALGRTNAVLGSTQANSTTTPAAITEFTTSLTPGTYEVKATLIWQSAATTTGAGFFINCTGGTVTKNVGHVYTTTTGGTATTGVADQATVAATFQMIEARAWRANNTNPGAFGGVDTINADQLAILEAVVVVTATTSMQIMFVSEVAASAITMQVGSILKIVKSA